MGIHHLTMNSKTILPRKPLGFDSTEVRMNAELKHETKTNNNAGDTEEDGQVLLLNWPSNTTFDAFVKKTRRYEKFIKRLRKTDNKIHSFRAAMIPHMIRGQLKERAAETELIINGKKVNVGRDMNQIFPMYNLTNKRVVRNMKTSVYYETDFDDIKKIVFRLYKTVDSILIKYILIRKNYRPQRDLTDMDYMKHHSFDFRDGDIRAWNIIFRRCTEDEHAVYIASEIAKQCEKFTSAAMENTGDIMTKGVYDSTDSDCSM